MRSQSFLEMRRRNALSIVAIVREHGDISRADLARAANLSPATVSSIVDDLLQAGVLKETGAKASTRGRRPIGLTFNARSRLAAGISIEPEFIRMALCDLDGYPISEATHKHAFEENIPLLTNFLVARLKDLLKGSGNPFKRLGAIGIALPGPISNDQTSMLDSVGMPTATIEYQRLWALLEQKLRRPIIIDSHVNMAVLAENTLGSPKPPESLLLVRLGPVIRSAFLVHGAVVHGQRGSAGELGHVPVPGNTRRCRCRNDGCLNTIAANGAVVDTCRSQGIEVTTVAEVLDGARAGNAVCSAAVAEIARGVGFALAMAINLLGPHRVIVSGSLTTGGDMFLVPLLATARRYALPNNFDKCVISGSILQQKGEPIGAALRVLQLQLDGLLIDVVGYGDLRAARPAEASPS